MAYVWPPNWYPATMGDIRRLDSRMNAQQTQIDKLVVELGGIKDSLTAVAADVTTLSDGVQGLEGTVANLQQQIKDLQATTSVDLSGLQSAADGLQTQVAAVKTAADAVVANLPTPAQVPAPPAPPAPTPVGGNTQSPPIQTPAFGTDPTKQQQ